MSRGTPDSSLVRFPSVTGLSPSSAAAFNPLFSSFLSQFRWSLPRSPFLQGGLGSSAFARHYLRNHFCFLFLWVLRCFSSPRLPISTLFIHVRLTGLFLPARFPHSDSHGSLLICSSSWIFAAYHVLLRLSVPRHSPYALRSLTLIFSNFRFIVLLVRFLVTKSSLYDFFVSLLIWLLPI